MGVQGPSEWGFFPGPEGGGEPTHRVPPHSIPAGVPEPQGQGHRVLPHPQYTPSHVPCRTPYQMARPVRRRYDTVSTRVIPVQSPSHGANGSHDQVRGGEEAAAHELDPQGNTALGLPPPVPPITGAELGHPPREPPLKGHPRLRKAFAWGKPRVLAPRTGWGVGRHRVTQFTPRPIRGLRGTSRGPEGRQEPKLVLRDRGTQGC
mmetsp:Transcript_88381/g.153433  ORF Transcript_88381/g.153433 Transcript_88381/m.153433 type:complete len:205 (-) Transcript_88381:419-1033(-)